MPGGESSQNRRSVSSKINYGRNTMDSAGFEGNLRCERKGGMGVEESSWRWVRRGVAERNGKRVRRGSRKRVAERQKARVEGRAGVKVLANGRNFTIPRQFEVVAHDRETEKASSTPVRAGRPARQDVTRARWLGRVLRSVGPGRVRKPATEVPRRRVGAQHYRPFLLASFLRNSTPMVQQLLPDRRNRGVRAARCAPLVPLRRPRRRPRREPRLALPVGRARRRGGRRGGIPACPCRLAA